MKIFDPQIYSAQGVPLTKTGEVKRNNKIIMLSLFILFFLMRAFIQQVVTMTTLFIR